MREPCTYKHHKTLGCTNPPRSPYHERINRTHTLLRYYFEEIPLNDAHPVQSLSCRRRSSCHLFIKTSSLIPVATFAFIWLRDSSRNESRRRPALSSLINVLAPFNYSARLSFLSIIGFPLNQFRHCFRRIILRRETPRENVALCPHRFRCRPMHICYKVRLRSRQ